MKKAYIIPEIQIYDADAENLLAGSPGKNYDVESPDNKTPTSANEENADDEVGSLAKQGDFFCDNFEYDFDLDF